MKQKAITNFFTPFRTQNTEEVPDQTQLRNCGKAPLGRFSCNTQPSAIFAHEVGALTEKKCKNAKKIIPQTIHSSPTTPPTTTHDTLSPIAEIHTIHSKTPNTPEKPPYTPIHTLQYTMMFDGCSKGNPGPAGAGAVIYLNGSEIWSRAIYVGERETNNMAEYTGLLLGLNEVVRRKIRVITVKGDSEVVIKQMLGKYKVKSENLLDIYNQAKDLEKHFDHIEYVHVYRHLNIRADALSNEGLAKVRAIK